MKHFITLASLLIISFLLPAQTLTTVSPDTALMNQWLTVTISGNGTSFTQGSVVNQVSFTQASLTALPVFNITPISNDSLQVDVVASPPGLPGMPCGFFDVEVSNQFDGTMILPNGFEILCPVIDTLAPNCANRGQQLTVNLSASGVDFLQGTPTVYFQQGTNTSIYASKVTAQSSTIINADFTIPIQADCGKYDAYLIPWQQWLPTIDSGSFEVKCEAQIQGMVYEDVNGNGTQDVGEKGLGGVSLLIMPGNIIAFTDTTGAYALDLGLGTYTVSAQVPAYYTQTSIPATHAVTLNTIGQVVNGKDFGLQGTANILDVKASLTGGQPIAGLSTQYWVTYKNVGTTTASGLITLDMDSTMSIHQAQPAPDSTSFSGLDTTYFWKYNNLLPTQQANLTFSATIPVLLPNAPLQHIVTITPIAGDTVPANNSDTLNQLVLSSYDPNDKLVKPAGVGVDKLTLKEETLDYTIRFQNTGNFMAFNIRIEDTLDTNLDLATFELVGASHPMAYNLDQDGHLTFTFTQILLPDSNSNEPASHGFVRYQIRPYAGLPDSTVIHNTAAIYFDFNPPVITNTTANNLVDSINFNNVAIDPILQPAISLQAVPNPFSDKTIIKLPMDRKGIEEVRLYNPMGQLIRRYIDIPSRRFVLKRDGLPTGIYLLEVVGEQKGYAKVMIR